MDSDTAETIDIEWQKNQVVIEDSANVQHTVGGGLVLLNVNSKNSSN